MIKHLWIVRAPFRENEVGDEVILLYLVGQRSQKNAKFVWSDACESSFKELKERLTTAPVLVLSDGTDGYVVYCDASRVGLGCVLMQNN